MTVLYKFESGSRQDFLRVTGALRKQGVSFYTPGDGRGTSLIFCWGEIDLPSCITSLRNWQDFCLPLGEDPTLPRIAEFALAEQASADRERLRPFMAAMANVGPIV